MFVVLNVVATIAIGKSARKHAEPLALKLEEMHEDRMLHLNDDQLEEMPQIRFMESEEEVGFEMNSEYGPAINLTDTIAEVMQPTPSSNIVTDSTLMEMNENSPESGTEDELPSHSSVESSQISYSLRGMIESIASQYPNHSNRDVLGKLWNLITSQLSNYYFAAFVYNDVSGWDKHRMVSWGGLSYQNVFRNRGKNFVVFYRPKAYGAAPRYLPSSSQFYVRHYFSNWNYPTCE